MDRRSWLWRRKSSDKSPGETESSGSISSYSERFSDDQVYSTRNNSQSPEVTSKATSNVEEMTIDNAKSLSEKLSSALLNISAKEDLVKQHAKVAEEAVSGWEKAENEVLALKQQLEAAIEKSSTLEDRVSHLDGALKECVRQLRQAKEEQEQKIQEAISKKTCEWESTKSELESQLIHLQAKLEDTPKPENAVSFYSGLDLCSKLEATEKANSSLKLEIFSLAKELKTRTIERDLSTQAAETASKQHLEGLKKMAKLEAECRMLKAIAHKASDNKSFGRNRMACAQEIGLMDDFLEMEKLAALPETESDHSALKAELETVIHRTAELEDRLETSQAQLALADQSKHAAEEQLRICKAEIENLHSRIGSLEEELQKEHDFASENLAKCQKLEDEVVKERASAYENLAKCHKLEGEILSMKQEAELHQRAEDCNGELKIKQDTELAVAASKFAECQKTIASLGVQLKCLASLDDFLMEEKSSENEVLSCKFYSNDPHLLKTDSESSKNMIT